MVLYPVTLTPDDNDTSYDDSSNDMDFDSGDDSSFV